MKETVITKTSVRSIDAELFQPFTISSGSHKRLENVLLGVRTREGVWGWGEAAIAPHITGETREQTLANLQKTAAWLEGRDVADYAGLLAGLEERLESNRCALAAAGMALLDALTRSLKMPLWRLYGSRPSMIRTDITVVIGTVAQAYDFAFQMRKRGFKIFKVKTGTNRDADFGRIAAVRRAAPKAEIYLDFNGAYDAKTAERFVAELGRHGIVPGVVEQPVAKDDREGLRYLSRKLKIPVCADESAYSVADAVELIKKKQATAINIKLAKFGLLRAREVWALARAAGVKLMMGEMLETELASACAAQFAAGLGGFDFIDLDTPLLIKDKVLRGGRYISSDGVYDVPAIKAGIGYAPK
ncbi:MAG: enolase C-terminal domain-like protein [Elusimicrobiales bacterium]|jgi:L-alanine-DL-glutamate epimerase-like enolase superfamily enzyme